MTENEAMDKWCPLSRTYAGQNRGNAGEILPEDKCIASQCMLWQWMTFTNYSSTSVGEHTVQEGRGYCGLAQGYYR